MTHPPIRAILALACLVILGGLAAPALAGSYKPDTSHWNADTRILIAPSPHIRIELGQVRRPAPRVIIIDNRHRPKRRHRPHVDRPAATFLGRPSIHRNPATHGRNLGVHPIR
ncbi:MAG: hypothetical protein AAFY65_09350 [Pseudomonadota bacterium]